AKVPCSDRCKCITCQNTEADRAARFPNQKITPILMESRATVAANRAEARNFPTTYSDDDSDDEYDEYRKPKDPKT
ncbi:unnamed protein product, partial [Gongylonema pulchrum]|uniref:CRC domain-containing protein n=2 Tax=Gongylonema pulchrum TaxID=637853 RepID=A0A183E7P9_9BILA